MFFYADQPEAGKPHQCSLSRKLASIRSEGYQALASGSRILWSDRLFRSILAIPVFRNITQIVRILPPPRVWIGTRLGHAKP